MGLHSRANRTFGPQKETSACAAKINTTLQGREILKVCGWNYVVDYKEWKERFSALLGKS
ncbi:MAG: hypothetical protein NG747_04565 [Candidatus Brocadia sp.]|nr:hypothetical protein [Candidatus Brocadia sp.]